MADRMQELMARRPIQDVVITLPDRAVEEYHERGFTMVPHVTSDEELKWLSEVYDLLFSGELDLPKGALVKDVSRPLSQQRSQNEGQSQVLFPESLYPQLRETVFYRNTERMARQILKGEKLTCWGHMPRKAARSMDIVHWHQDEGYADPNFDRDSASFWMPLNDATAQSGAMSFIPGSHLQPLARHGFPGDDPLVTAIMTLDPVPVEKAVLHPIPAGGVSIHHHRAMHYSGPNLTDQPRRAYANVWNSEPVRRLVPYDRPWYWRKKEARDNFNNEKDYYHDDSFADATRQRQAR